MTRVYCVEWSDEDEVQGPHNVGWSLHLSRNDAEAYVRAHAARYDWHGPPHGVEVPDEVWDAVRGTRHGLFWATPCECPFPRVKEHVDVGVVADAGERPRAG